MIRNAIQRFFYGRYGSDPLNLFLLGVYLLFYMLYLFTQFDPLYYITLVLMIVTFFRLFSRNPIKRRAENAKFMKLAAPFLQWYRLRKTIHRDKDHCYFKCPSCGQQLRVPRGKGKITVSCRGCGASFQEKS